MNREEYLMNVIPEAWAAVTGAKKRVQGMQQAADAAGVAYKQAQPDTAKKAVLDDMKAEIGTLLAKYSDSAPPELVDQVFAMVITTLAQGSAPPEETEPDAMPEEEMAVDGEEVDPEADTMPLDEEEDGMKPRGKAHNHASDSVTEKQTLLLDRLLNTQAEIQDQQSAIVKAVGVVPDLVKQVQTLASKVEKMDAQLRLRPKASVAKETLLDENKLDAALKEALEAGAEPSIYEKMAK